MPYRQNVGNGVSAAKDTATEADVRYPKTFHAGKGTKAKIGEILDCTIRHLIPGTKKQVIKRGVYLNEDLEIDGDENLISKNIRSGVSIFGIAGDENVVDTSGGNLESRKMLKGTIGFSRGRSVNGEIENLSDSSFSPSDSTAYNDSKIIGSAHNDFVGAFDYSVLGYIAGKIRIHIANLIPSNIRSGARVGGIGGYILGTFTESATATKAYILKGKTAGIKGQMITGEMEDIVAVDPAKSVVMLNGVLYVRMSNGAHIKNAASGYPEVSVPQQAVASAVGINGDYILDSATYLGVRGKIQSMAGTTITPQTYKQTVWSAWKRMTGNVEIAAVPLPPANAIKKGYRYWIGGNYVDGTFEGYVTGAADIYRQGAVNPSYSLGLYSCPEYEDSDGNHYQALTQYRTNTIYVHTSYNEYWSNSIQVHTPIDLTPINNIHISIRVADGKNGPKSTEVAFGVYDGVGSVTKPVAGFVGRFSAYSTYDEVSFSVKSITRPLYLRFWFSCDSHVSWEINRIWFD